MPAEAVAQDLGWNPEPGHFHLFALDIDHLSYLRYDDSTGDQYVTQWPPGREYARRGITAKPKLASLGARCGLADCAAPGAEP